jgi:hypothetical protein
MDRLNVSRNQIPPIIRTGKKQIHHADPPSEEEELMMELKMLDKEFEMPRPCSAVPEKVQIQPIQNIPIPAPPENPRPPRIFHKRPLRSISIKI